MVIYVAIPWIQHLQASACNLPYNFHSHGHLVVLHFGKLLFGSLCMKLAAVWIVREGKVYYWCP